MKYGYKPSILDGTEKIYSLKQNITIPEAYTYEPYMSPVINQGSNPTCVPCSISAHLNWNRNITAKTNKIDNGIDIKEIYNIRQDKRGDGMTIKEALHYLYKHGVKSNVGNMKIRKYAMIKSPLTLKQALLMNGPCIAALKVYNSGLEFWDKNNGEFLGGHCICIVGWNKEGFIIRNSWGSSWGNKGYTLISYDDFKYFLELWTIII
ncbi:MAG: C1 family peptidase [Clostridia bacterium]|nr:C1 family peptidase [Clostridia bacterium]